MLPQTSWWVYEVARIRAFDNNILLDLSFTALSQCTVSLESWPLEELVSQEGVFNGTVEMRRGMHDGSTRKSSRAEDTKNRLR